MGSADRIRDIWGPRTAFAAASAWPSRIDTHVSGVQSPGDVERWVPSACLLCSNGCGLEIGVAGGRIVGVRGRADDRVNHGRLGPKGLFGWQGQQRDRLERPLVRRDGVLREASWGEAMGVVVGRSQELLAAKGALSHGFYTSGQLMLEEYYTLAVIGKAGIGTPHMDGNTRLCTATAAAALKESFGTDGQPGSYTDLDLAEAVFHYGHNVAETQTVLWARMLDRLAGPNPPVHVCVDPRETEVAKKSDVHLAVRPGTNLALMNGLVREVINHDWVDHDFIEAHTHGFDELSRTVEPYGLEATAAICGVTARDIARAAEVFGQSDRVVSTVLQGFYQSHQATAASVQVNNLHLLRGLIGRPGAGLLQMNGQPTAQNNRETGADGDLPGFRNWENPDHVRELADLWDVDPAVIPHWVPPTHAMQIFRYAEQGSIGFLWIAGTNPAVSLPELSRIRSILASDKVFVVVNDGYLTETAELADVVLPSALWGEKTGTFTNADRTVHLSDQAVDPPGEARSDLEIWVDYARRMGFADRSGRPLPGWETPEEAFDAWRECSRGRPCDYTGLSYTMLRERGGIQWPCTEASPDGTERLYTDHEFNTGADYCETFGHDLLTGASITPEKYRAQRLDGRARLVGAPFTPPVEEPGEGHPLSLTTGRTVYQFHTRTKTGRAPELNGAAPEAWCELHPEDAAAIGVGDGGLVTVSTPRGEITVQARVNGARRGTVFIPFHYGGTDDAGRPRAANELTLTAWDPVSKQPLFKGGAVHVAVALPQAAMASAEGDTPEAPASERAEAPSGGSGKGSGKASAKGSGTEE
jgi:anaerobic selenocysteine-containing dehydrogenase